VAGHNTSAVHSTTGSHFDLEGSMKFGFRRPSFRKSLAARTSFKRYIRHSLGVKAPRGWGWLTNPKKAAYNRVYYRTTFGWQNLLRSSRRRSLSGCLVMLFAIAIGAILLVMELKG
jgi:hypothetical protein